MTSKLKIAIGTAAFVLFIAVAAYLYETLSGSVNPEIMLAEQPASISTPAAQTGDSEENTETEPEEPAAIQAPDFTVEDFDGNKIKLSDMLGKPIVINFWASWCPPCKAEMPDFDKVYADLGGDINFMMVNMTDGQRETKKSGEKYVSEQGFTFPVYYDTEGEAAYTYGIRNIPTTIFIDKNGIIITGAEGQLNEEILRYGISLIQYDDID